MVSKAKQVEDVIIDYALDSTNLFDFFVSNSPSNFLCVVFELDLNNSSTTTVSMALNIALNRHSHEAIVMPSGASTLSAGNDGLPTA